MKVRVSFLPVDNRCAKTWRLAVAALGIPTTRALTLLTIPLPYLPVFREGTIHPSSLLTRVAPSFIRVGHFEALNPPSSAAGGRQFFVGGGGWIDDQTEEEGEEEGNGNLEGLRDLGDWMKEIMEVKEGWKSWVDEVIKKNAEMVAKWQVYGYMNGVINTDNVTLMGITIDYGPYAFMDVFDEKHVSSEFYRKATIFYLFANNALQISQTLAGCMPTVIKYPASNSHCPNSSTLYPLYSVTNQSTAISQKDGARARQEKISKIGAKKVKRS